MDNRNVSVYVLGVCEGIISRLPRQSNREFQDNIPVVLVFTVCSLLQRMDATLPLVLVLACS